jgi:hypothetical protein
MATVDSRSPNQLDRGRPNSIPHLTASPSPRFDESAHMRSTAAGAVAKPPLHSGGRAPSAFLALPSGSPARARRGSCEEVHVEFSMKKRIIRPDRVCGLAPKLIATSTQAADVLTTYASLQTQRAQGYYRAAVWYAAASRALGVKAKSAAFLALCDASDHITHLANATPSAHESAPQTPLQIVTAPLPVQSNNSTMRSGDGPPLGATGGGGSNGGAPSDEPGMSLSTHQFGQLPELEGAASSPVAQSLDEQGTGGKSSSKRVHAGTKHTNDPPGRDATKVYAPGTELDLKGTYLGLRGTLAVLSTIPLLPHLASIRMQRADLDSTLMALLCHACRGLPSLEFLDVSDNGAASSIGAEAVADLVARVPSLIEVRIDGVETIGPVFRRIEHRVEANRVRLFGGDSPLASIERDSSDNDSDDDDPLVPCSPPKSEL